MMCFQCMFIRVDTFDLVWSSGSTFTFLSKIFLRMNSSAYAGSNLIIHRVGY